MAHDRRTRARAGVAHVTVVEPAETFEVVGIELAHGLDRRFALGLEELPRALSSEEPPRGLEREIEAITVELLLFPQAVLACPMSQEKLLVSGEDLVRAVVEPEIHDLAAEMGAQLFVLILPLLPARGHDGDGALDAEAIDGIDQGGSEPLRPQKHDRRHERDIISYESFPGNPRPAQCYHLATPSARLQTIPEVLPMHVIFVEPAFPHNQRQFVRALAQVGARVTAIGEAPAQALPGEIQQYLHDYEQVPSVVHEPSLSEAVRRVQARGWVDRLEATVEAHILTTAKVRAACTIPGTSVETAYLCRDKPAMKEALRKGGIPCAQSTGASSAEEVKDFVDRVGFPVILKPRDAAGAAGTWRASNGAELDRAIQDSGVGSGASVAVEEFIEGHEGFFDTLTIDGEIAHYFACHYYPNVLEAMRTRWISPQFIATNRLDESGYDEVKTMAKKVIEILGIGTSATHMEWFFGPKGLKFSEIGCRPPGVGAWDLYCAGNDMDVYKEWAMTIVHGHPSQQPSRNYSAGIINLRPECDGRIAGYEGLELLDHLSGHVIDAHLPPPGTPTQPVSAGYMANAWVRLKHPDYDRLRHLLDRVGETVKVRAH